MSAKQFEFAKSLQFLGSIVLRIPAKPIDRVTKDSKIIAEEMLYLMTALHAAGLTANQVGLLSRIIVVNLNSRIVMINPELTFQSEATDIKEEGCLSLPSFWANVKRPQIIKVKYLDETGKDYHLKAEDLAARIIQHEIDHLNGILIIDKQERYV